MGNFNRFMKQNKAEDNKLYEYVASKKFVDDKGQPIAWKFKKLPLKEYESLRDYYSYDKKVGDGKFTRYISQLKTQDFNANLIVKCCVEPDLNDADLQDSYGVKGAENLLYEMIDDVGEYTDLITFIQKIHGLDVYGQEEMDTKAKN